MHSYDWLTREKGSPYIIRDYKVISALAGATTCTTGSITLTFMQSCEMFSVESVFGDFVIKDSATGEAAFTNFHGIIEFFPGGSELYTRLATGNSVSDVIKTHRLTGAVSNPVIQRVFAEHNIFRRPTVASQAFWIGYGGFNGALAADRDVVASITIMGRYWIK